MKGSPHPVEIRIANKGGKKVEQKRCMSECGQWRDITDFHFRTPARKTRSSRCKFCAAKAQRDLRLRKQGKQEARPGGRYGRNVDHEKAELPELPRGTSRRKAS